MICSGIMSGTSFDGIDVSICEFNKNIDGKKEFKLLAYKEYPYPDQIKQKLFEMVAQGENISIKDVSQMNFALARLYSDALINLCLAENINIKEIDVLGVHGQTVWHNPEAESFCGIKTKSTLQLVSIPAMNEYLGIKVVGDFRSADIANSGQGAPLIPIFDFDFFKSKLDTVCCLNIGGISNITYLPKGCKIDNVLGFDCGAGNVLIDLLTQKFFNSSYDKDGAFARKGKIINSLLDDLKKTEFIKAPIPKSTGRELFNLDFINQFQLDKYNSNDIVATFTEFTAWAIAYNVNALSSKPKILYFSGGGAKNTFLIERIHANLPNTRIKNIVVLGIDPDAKEAIGFAYLAYKYMLNETANVPSVTGANKACKLGVSV